MNLPTNTKPKFSLKDISKGQKIVAAIYLVTNHMSDSDPLKLALRQQSLNIVEGIESNEAYKLQAMLNIALLSGFISEKNASLIKDELMQIVDSGTHLVDISTLLPVTGQKPLKDKIYSIGHDLSFINKMSDTNKQSSNFAQSKFSLKNKRKDDILSFVDKQKSVGIKDIVKLFPDLSEKTIQRELTKLVSTGQITKRGSKRWSLYMAVAK